VTVDAGTGGRNGRLDARVEALEREVAALRDQLDAVWEAIATRPADPAVGWSPSPVVQPPSVRPRRTTPPPRPQPQPAAAKTTPAILAPPPAAKAQQPTAPPPRRELDLSALLSAKTLSWAGGAVMALGIVFLFALAVNRGWIGSTARVALGGLASAAVFAGGLEIARRYGRLYSAFGAVGAGLAGGYATVLAAAGLYDLVPEAAGLLAAAAIAAVGVAVALRWSSEIVAGLGLIGAGVVPVFLLGDTGGPTVLGTSFTAVVLGAIAVVGVARGWRVVLGVGSALAVVETLGLFLWEDELTTSLLILGAAVWAVLVSTGISWQIVRDREPVGGLTATYVIGSGAFAWWSVAALFTDEPQTHRGIALLGAAVVYGILASAFWRRRDLGVLLAIVAVAVGAIGVADALSGGSLTYTFAAEAAALAVAARALRERRFQLAALGYLALSAMHALVVEAEPHHLVVASSDPAAGAPSLLAIAAAAAVLALQSRIDDEPRDAGVFAPLRDLSTLLRERATAVRVVLLGVAALLVLDAAALGTLQLAQWSWDGTEYAFAHGQLVLTIAGSVLAAGVAAAGLARSSRPVVYAALLGLGLLTVKGTTFDVDLTERVWPWSLAAVAAAMLVAGSLLERRKRLVDFGGELALLQLLVAATLAGVAAYGRLSGDTLSVALLGIAAVYALVAAGFFGRAHRDYSTVACGSALILAAVGEARLLDGQALPILWAASAAALVLLARAVEEPRFQLGALGYLAAAAVPTFALHAPPADFLRASEHPGSGVPSVLALAAAAAVAALRSRPLRERRDELDESLARLQRLVNGPGRWVVGVIALYGLSLSILELAELVGTRDVASNFRGGHSGVSAVWGALGLALLYLGLRRASALRVAGFVLFGVSLAKLFVYDLSRLSSITRALSFLAVGAVLLLGGLFYQRLGEGRADVNGPSHA